jgi:hypothetical protein
MNQTPHAQLKEMANKGGIAIREASLKRYYDNPAYCKHCNKLIIVKDNQMASVVKKKRFCNHSCAARFNNKGKIRIKLAACMGCGLSLNTGSKYCTQTCQTKHNWSVWCKEVEINGCFEGYTYKDVGGKVAKPKRYCLEKQEGKCLICGIKEWLGKPFPNVLDHVDGDSGNWRVNNIRVICRNCDGQTSTFCGKNRGKSTRKLKLVQK